MRSIQPCERSCELLALSLHALRNRLNIGLMGMSLLATLVTPASAWADARMDAPARTAASSSARRSTPASARAQEAHSSDHYQGQTGARAEATSASLVVQTQYGPVEGFVDTKTYSWLGIPFAASPTGYRRWQPPAAPASWSTTRPALEFAQPCSQLTTAGTLQGGEDCLYVNVWKPQTTSTSPLPIMVWIHGGGNEVGATSDYLYGGQNIAADNNVMVISISYRLSDIGWFNHPALHTGDPQGDSGNFGLLDQIIALKWVRNNAAAFGGDVRNVTAFGESAGGMNLWALLTSPLAQGLFDKAIILSGYPQWITVEGAQNTSQGVLEDMVIKDGLTDSANVDAFLASMGEVWIQDYLYNADTLTLLTSAADTTPTFTNFYGAQDGTVIPSDILGAIADGQFSHIPLMLGSMRDEMKMFLCPLFMMRKSRFNSLMTDTYGDWAPELEKLYSRGSYSPATYYNQFTDIADHLLEGLNSVYLPSVVGSEVPVWVYNFQYDNLKKPFHYAIGAGHSMELPFVFGNFQESFYPPNTTAERAALAQVTQTYFTCFAKTGNPSSCSSSVRPWPQFTVSGVDKYQRMLINTTTQVLPLSTSDIDRANIWLDYYGWSQMPTMSY